MICLLPKNIHLIAKKLEASENRVHYFFTCKLNNHSSITANILLIQEFQTTASYYLCNSTLHQWDLRPMPTNRCCFVVVVTTPLPCHGGTARNNFPHSCLKPNQIKLGEKRQHILNQNGSPNINYHWRVPKSRLLGHAG